MANNYYQMTGALNLKTITPVIKALFGVFSVKEHGENEAYIKRDADDISYTSVADQIASVMSIDPVDTIKDYLVAMAEKLGKKDEVQAFLKDVALAENEDADFDLLFQLALLMDDGHGLSSVWRDGAWTCDKLCLGEFGGDGLFVGKSFTLHTGSYIADQYGQPIDDAIGKNDLEQAVKLLSNHVEGLLNGIRDETIRNSIRILLADSLRQQNEASAPSRM